MDELYRRLQEQLEAERRWRDAESPELVAADEAVQRAKARWEDALKRLPTNPDASISAGVTYELLVGCLGYCLAHSNFVLQAAADRGEHLTQNVKAIHQVLVDHLKDHRGETS